MAKPTIGGIQSTLAASGVEFDEVTSARLAKALKENDDPKARARAVLEALGVRDFDEESLEQLVAVASNATDPREAADAIMIGPCPRCGADGRSAEDEVGIDNLAAAICPRCGLLWCPECGLELSRKKPRCENPTCWLNSDEDLEALGLEGEDEGPE